MVQMSNLFTILALFICVVCNLFLDEQNGNGEYLKKSIEAFLKAKLQLRKN